MDTNPDVEKQEHDPASISMGPSLSLAIDFDADQMFKLPIRIQRYFLFR